MAAFSPKTAEYEISYQSLIRVVVVGLIVFALFYLGKIIAALLFAVVVASGIEPGVRWLQRWRVPRILAVLIIYLLTIGLLAGIISTIVPVIVDEFGAFLDSFPRYQRSLLQGLRSFQNFPFSSPFLENAESAVLNPPLDIQSLGRNTVDVLFRVLGGVFSGLILIVTSFYLASQEKGIELFLRMVTPLKHEEYVIDLWSRSQAKMGQWLRGQLLLGLIVGVLVYLALTLLGIRYALLLAILAGIFELIPIIGPILSAVPAVFFGFLTSPLTGLTVAVVYFVIQQTESNLLVPVVMKRAVGLNPLVVVIALLIGVKLGGILGMFLSVPFASVAVEFLTDTDRKKRGTFQYAGGGTR